MNAVLASRLLERRDGFAMVRLARVMIGSVRDQHHAGDRAGLELVAHSPPPPRGGSPLYRKVRAKLVPVAGKVVKQHAVAIGRRPTRGVADRPSGSTVP